MQKLKVEGSNEPIANGRAQTNIIDPLVSDKDLREKIIGISCVTWWKWRKQGKNLPKALIIGRRRFYRQSDISSWLESLSNECQ